MPRPAFRLRADGPLFVIYRQKSQYLLQEIDKAFHIFQVVIDLMTNPATVTSDEARDQDALLTGGAQRLAHP